MGKLRVRKELGASNIYIKANLCYHRECFVRTTERCSPLTDEWQKVTIPGQKITKRYTFLWDAPEPGSSATGYIVWQMEHELYFSPHSHLESQHPLWGEQTAEPEAYAFNVVKYMIYLKLMTFSGFVSEEACEVQKTKAASSKSVLPLLNWIEIN